MAVSPAASPAPSTNSGLKGLLGEACTSIIAQQQARRTPSFRNAAATQVPAAHTSPRSPPASVGQPPQHSTIQPAASSLLQSSPKSPKHALPAAVQLPSTQQQQQQQEQQLAVYSSTAAAPAQFLHPASDSQTQPTHSALFAQGHSNWLDNPGSAVWSGAASDATLAGKHSDSTWQEAHRQQQQRQQQQQPSAAMFGGQIDFGNESGDEQLNDHNMWSQYLNPQPEAEPEPQPIQPQPQAEHQLQLEPKSATQHVMPQNNQAPSLTQSAPPDQLTVSQSGPVLAQPTVQSVVPDQQLPIVSSHSSSPAIACSDGDAPASKDAQQSILTRQDPDYMLQGKASMDVENAQHEASLQAQQGSTVAYVEADSAKQAAAQSTQGAEAAWLLTVEPAQQAQQASATAGGMADDTDAQHQDGTETRSEGKPAELDSNSCSPQTDLHHDLPADCAMADAERVTQSPSGRPVLSDLQGSHSDGPEAGQGLSLLSDEAQRAEHASVKELAQVQHAQQALRRSSDHLEEPHHAQAADAQAGEAQHAQQASGVQIEEAQHAQQASDIEMDDAQNTPDIQIEEAEQPQQVSGPDTSQTQHAQQEHVVEMLGPQQTLDVDVTATQHAQQATDAESPEPQQASDSALHEAQQAQQAPDVEVRDAQQAAGPVQQDLQPGAADTAEDLMLQPRRSRRGKGPAQDSTDPQIGSATEVAPEDATKAAAAAAVEAALSTDQEEAVVAPPATRSSAAKHAAGKTRSAKPATKAAAKHNGAHKAAGLPETHKLPGSTSQQQQQQQQPPAKRSHKKQPKRQRLTAPEGAGQQTVSKASAAGAGKQVQEAAQKPNAAGDGTGETQLASWHTASAASPPLCWQPLWSDVRQCRRPHYNTFCIDFSTTFFRYHCVRCVLPSNP